MDELKITNDMFVVHEHELDKEWIKQPQLVYQVSSELARVQFKMDSLKLQMTTLESELAVDIRSRPEKYKLDKVTEKAIENVIANNSERKELEEELTKLQLESSMLKAALNALEHKKKALENLVQLYSLDYFANPQAAKSEKAEEELNKQVRAKFVRQQV